MSVLDDFRALAAAALRLAADLLDGPERPLCGYDAPCGWCREINDGAERSAAHEPSGVVIT